MKTIKIPICSFGKDLKIDDIILGVMYMKGDKNDKGDMDNDYVEVILK